MPASLAVIDIDGVVADVRHRLHHLERRPRDWTAFFAEADADPPLPVGIALVLELARQHEIAYLTGRPERLRSVTQAWLDRHGLPAAQLIMRQNDDHRPARFTKPAALRHFAGDRPVAVVVDDDPAVCAAFAAAGYPVRRADWADRPASLDVAQEQAGRT